MINTELCNYDGGDCCGSSIDTTYCIECQCCDIGGCNATINGGNGGNEGNDNEYLVNKEIWILKKCIFPSIRVRIWPLDWWWLLWWYQQQHEL